MKNLLSFSTLTAILIAILLLVTVHSAHADDNNDEELLGDPWTGNVSGYLGRKFVSENDWPNLDSQRSAGVVADFGKKNWPVSIATDLLFAADVYKKDGIEETAGTTEIHVGVRKVFDLDSTAISPYIGGGLAIVSASLEYENAGVVVDDDDLAFGGWVGAGAYYAITPNLNLGFDLRYSKAEVNLFDQGRESGGLNVGVTIGYHW